MKPVTNRPPVPHPNALGALPPPVRMVITVQQSKDEHLAHVSAHIDTIMPFDTALEIAKLLKPYLKGGAQ